MQWEPRELEQYPFEPGRQFYRRSWLGDKSATRPSHGKALVYIELSRVGVTKFSLRTHIGRGDGAYIGLGKRQQADAEAFLAERLAEVEAELERLGWEYVAGHWIVKEGNG